MRDEVKCFSSQEVKEDQFFGVDRVIAADSVVEETDFGIG